MITPFDIANAVAAELNAGFAGMFTVAVTPLPGVDLAELAGLTVSVVPKSLTPQHVARGARADTCVIDIGIQQRLSKSPEIEIPPLCTIAMSVLGFMWNRRLPALPAVASLGAVIEPIYDPEHLRQFRVFTSIVSVTYRV